MKTRLVTALGVGRPGAARAVVFVSVVAAIFTGMLGSRLLAALAEPKPMLVASFPPTSVVVGTPNTLTFTFTAVETAKGTVSIRVPTGAAGSPWTAPQVGNPGAGGLVTTSQGSCNTAGPPAIGADLQTILVAFRCAKNKSFSVTYGAGAAQATAATIAGVSAFTTLVKTGRDFIPTTLQPMVTLTPGPTAALTLDDVIAPTTAGEPVLLFVRSFDQYGNFTPGYRGTVTFSSTDPQALLPPDHTFTALEGGSLGFIAEVRTVGPQSFAVADVGGVVTGDTLGPWSIAPGAPAQIDVGISQKDEFPAWGGSSLTGIGSCGALVEDQFGNNVAGAALQWSSTDPEAALGAGTPGVVAFCNFITVGEQTVTVTVQGHPDVTDTETVNVVGGPVARPDDVTVLDPTHTYGMSVWPINVLHNDIQQRQSPQFYNPLLGFFNNLYRVTQPTYFDEATGTLYQVGVLGFSSDLFFLIWNLNPDADVVPLVEGAVLMRCMPDATGADVCRVPVPMEVEYTITDGVNDSTSTLTLHLETPDTPATPIATTLTPDSAELSISSNATTTATVQSPSGVYVPVIQPLLVNTTTPAPQPPNGITLPSNVVTVGLDFEIVADDCTGPDCVLDTGTTPANVVGPSGLEGALQAGSGDVVSGAYSFAGQPRPSEGFHWQHRVLVEAKLSDVWRGGDGTIPPPTLVFPWLYTTQHGVPVERIVPVQIIPSPNTPDPETHTPQYSFLTLVFNFGVSLCTSAPSPGACTNLPTFPSPPPR